MSETDVRKAARKSRRSYGTGSISEVNGRYYGSWYVGGRRIKKVLGPIRLPGTGEGLTRMMAENRLLQLRTEIRSPPVSERLTVAEVGEALLTHLEKRGRKPSTMRGYRSTLKNQIEPRIGSKNISTLKRVDVERFVDACLDGGLKPKTVHNAQGFLHHICEHAVRHGWATENPARGVDPPKSHDGDGTLRFLDMADVQKLLAVIPDSRFGRVRRVLYLTAVSTGMRQGELLALRWMDVDFDAKKIRVERNLYRNGQFVKPKSNRTRTVPLSPVLAVTLREYRDQSDCQADGDLVFANPLSGLPLNGNAVLRGFQGELERAGVRKVRFHDLRHTFGTHMAAAGVSIRTLMAWMGHTDLKTTLIYAAYAPSEHEADLVDRAFAGTNLGTKLSEQVPNSEQLKTSNPEETHSFAPAA